MTHADRGRRTQRVSLSRAPREPVALERMAVVLDPGDDVAIAKEMLAPGTVLVTAGGAVRVCQAVPVGHKVALRPVGRTEPVRRYGQVIGFANGDIAPGEHVHSHNLGVGDRALELDHGVGAGCAAVAFVPEAERRSFLGFRRGDGRVGTRNFVAVLASVNCSSTATRQIAETVRSSGLLARYPGVDGILAFAVKGGCGAHHGSPDMWQLQRTLGGIVDHPNVAAYVALARLRGEPAGRDARPRRRGPGRRRPTRADDPAGRRVRPHRRRRRRGGCAAAAARRPGRARGGTRIAS